MSSVLIVDDEPNIRKMVGALLTAEGYEVSKAQNGASGLARADQDEPDAVLLDLMMPGELDGMATLARLRIEHPETAVIMMSGRAGLSDAVAATKLGAVVTVHAEHGEMVAELQSRLFGEGKTAPKWHA